jgi:hypothetical protein
MARLAARKQKKSLVEIKKVFNMLHIFVEREVLWPSGSYKLKA